MGWNFLLQHKKTTKNPMIEAILFKFQSFRNHLFQIFDYRSGATMDLIDAVSAEISAIPAGTLGGGVLTPSGLPIGALFTGCVDGLGALD